MRLDSKRLNTIAYKGISDRIKSELNHNDSTKNNVAKKNSLGVDEFGWVRTWNFNLEVLS